MSVTLGKYILRAIRSVGPMNLLLLSGLALLRMKAYDECPISEFALRLETLLWDRMGIGYLLFPWIEASALLVALLFALLLLARLARWRRLPPDLRVSHREVPGVAAVLFSVWFSWYWGLSHSMVRYLYVSYVALLVTSALWLTDTLMSSPPTQHRDP